MNGFSRALSPTCHRQSGPYLFSIIWNSTAWVDEEEIDMKKVPADYLKIHSKYKELV